MIIITCLLEVPICQSYFQSAGHIFEYCSNISFDSILIILILLKGYHNIDKFISNTIPSFAKNNILTVGGVIYLPFQIFFSSQIVANIKTLKKSYSISFIGCTNNNTLWSCNQKISKAEMQQVFDKKIDQEELYYTVTEQ